MKAHEEKGKGLFVPLRESLVAISDMAIESLTEASLLQAVDWLAGRDADLAEVVQRYGPPPLWAREPGFPTLVHIVLEQQVSLASALAAYNNLKQALGRITPRKFLKLADVDLRAIGFSRQKAGYVRAMAQAIVQREFDPDGLHTLSDAEVHTQLIQLKGIGHWSAGIYLLMVLGRPDIWPHGDIALASAAQRVKKLPARPTFDELDQMAEQWRPYRAVAARLLWHDYLNRQPKPHRG